jgi:hypothetical protein
MIDYKVVTQVTVDLSPLEVDGVEIITRKEREAIERHFRRLQQHMQSEMERALLYGDSAVPVALPKLTT